jgi:hypothetical protein
MFVRSSPDASYHGAFYEQFSDKNILRTAKSGEFLGYATGMQSYDQKNDVKFIRGGIFGDGRKCTAGLEKARPARK